MRLAGVVLLAIVLANALLSSVRGSASAERASLVDAANDVSRQSDRARTANERQLALEALITRASSHEHDPRSIGELRDILVATEDGLELERLSLDFRPEERLPPGIGGSRVDVSLRGSFDAVYEYLRRIESMFLPLSPENLRLRRDASNVTLDVRWGARWPVDGPAPIELDATEVAALNAWVTKRAESAIARNVFSFRSSGPAGQPTSYADVSAPASELIPSESAPLVSGPEQPVLAGFVLARPELEPDVRRRVLAALSYEGEVRLVMVGDTVGEFVVDQMEARDSVTLLRADTGERVRLTLE